MFKVRIGSAAALAAVVALAPALAAHAPHDVIHELAVSPAFAQDHTLFAAVELTDLMLFARSTDGGVSWQVYGLPMMAAENVWGFAFSPTYAADGTVFAATSAGLWRTTDRGDSWSPVNAGLPSLGVNGIALSPGFALDGIALAATDAGCARSTDGGLTWVPVATAGSAQVLQRVAFAPAGSPQPTAFIGGKRVYRSDDAGEHWTTLVTFTNAIETLAVSPNFASDQTLALGFGRFGGGVRLSTNGGASFALANTGLSDLFVYELALAGDGTTFAATKGGSCFRASTPLSPWEPVTDGFEANSPLTNIHLTECAVSPDYANDQTVFCAGYEGLYRSTSAGEPWRQADVYSQHLNRHLVFSPGFAQDGLLFAGNYGGGVFAWHDDGPPATPITPAPGTSRPAPQLPFATHPPPADPFAPSAWDARSNTLTTLFSDALAISPAFATDHTLFYGYADLRRSTDAGLSWTGLVKPAGMTIVRRIGVSPAFATDHTLLIGSSGEGVFRSTDSGSHWIVVSGGLPPALVVQAIRFSPAFASDGTVFIATQGQGLWRSHDAGLTWAPASTGIGVPWVRAIDTLPDFPADPTLFAGTIGAGVFRSLDGGDSWEPINAGLPDGPLFIESLACSQELGSGHTVFIGTRDHGVFRSMNRGDDWQAVDTGLPGQLAVRAVAISPAFATDRTLVIGAYDWTWISRDAGDHWSRLPGWIRADDGHPSVLHSEAAGFADDGGPSAWVKVSDPLCMGNACAESTQSGDWEEFEFRGSRIEWYANSGASSGIASVAVDGEFAGTVDLYSRVPSSQQLRFARNFPGVGLHVIRITNRGMQNAESTGITIRSDGYVCRF